MTHEILPEAQEEFDNAVAYLNDQTAGLGDEFRQEVIAVLREVISRPDQGSFYDGELQYRPVKRFRDLILYAIRGGKLIVVAVMHEARRPGYWKNRLN